MRSTRPYPSRRRGFDDAARPGTSVFEIRLSRDIREDRVESTPETGHPSPTPLRFMPTSPLSGQMVADIEIAQRVTMRPIVDVAAGLCLGRRDLILKGDYIGKVRLAAEDPARKARPGKLVLLPSTTPHPYGAGAAYARNATRHRTTRVRARGAQRVVKFEAARGARTGRDMRRKRSLNRAPAAMERYLGAPRGSPARRARREGNSVTLDRREHPV